MKKSQVGYCLLFFLAIWLFSAPLILAVNYFAIERAMSSGVPLLLGRLLFLLRELSLLAPFLGGLLILVGISRRIAENDVRYRKKEAGLRSLQSEAHKSSDSANAGDS